MTAASKVVTRLREQGHEAVGAAPDTGVDTLTGEGLADALEGASVVVDVSNSPSFEDAAVLEFFETSTATCSPPRRWRASGTTSRCRWWAPSGGRRAATSEPCTTAAPRTS